MASVLFAGMLVLSSVVPQGEVQPRYPAEVETEASQIFNTTMSPFCPGLLIANCPSPGAAQLKEEIRAELAAGVSADSVRAQLFAVYGAQVLATPPARGLGLVAWVMPALAIVGVGTVLLWWIRARGRPKPLEHARPALDPEAEARLERELAEL